MNKDEFMATLKIIIIEAELEKDRAAETATQHANLGKHPDLTYEYLSRSTDDIDRLMRMKLADAVLGYMRIRG